MEYCEKLTAEEFDAFASGSEMNSIFQSSAWAETKSNWKPLYIGVKDNGQIIAAALVLLRQAAMGYSFAYCPRGPIMDYQNEELLSFFLTNMKNQLKHERAALCKFDPHVIIGSIPYEEKDQVASFHDDVLVHRLESCGCRFCGYTMMFEQTIQPRIQMNYPIEDPFDARIPHKTVKKIHSSRNKGVIIREEHNADSLEAMVSCTENRHQIRLRNREYFQSMLDSFGKEAIVLSAYQQDQLLSSCLLVSSASTAEILYSGYDDRFKHTNSTYPLRYEAIRWAAEHGKKNFCFGGVEGTMDDGLTIFKSSFRPMIDIYIGEFDLMTMGISPFISRHFSRIKNRISM